jgi:hypothetical protein
MIADPGQERPVGGTWVAGAGVYRRCLGGWALDYPAAVAQPDDLATIRRETK